MEENSDKLQLNEIAVLGNILSDNSGYTILTAIQHLTPDNFSDIRNKTIFEAMAAINAKGETPDYVTVVDTLENQHMLEAIGGQEYLDLIVNNTTRIGSIEGYISRIKDNALLQRFLGKLKNIYEGALVKPISDVSDFIGTAEKEINEIAKERSVKEAKRLAEISPSLVNQWVEQSKEFRERGIPADGITGVKTGYEKLDFLTKGWHKGNMIIVGARPSVGKTAFTLNLLYNVAKQKIPVIFFSLEMSSEAIEMRLLELASDLTSTEINSMDFAPDSTPDKLKVNCHSREEEAKVSKLKLGLDTLAELPFYVDENPGTTMMDIAAKCRKLIKGQNIKAGLIAIDYIGLIQSPKGGNNDSRNQQVADISRQLKQLARELKVPIIALSQLSRESAKRGQDHRPQLTDLRDSGSLEQDADMVFFLYRADYFNDNKKDDEEEVEEEYSPNSLVELSLQKNRDGQLGTVKYVFDKEHCRFTAQTDEDDYGGPY